MEKPFKSQAAKPAVARSGKTAAVNAFTEELLNEKNTRIRKIMDDAAKLLEAEGVKYFIGAVDMDPANAKAFCQSEIQGQEFIHILDMALPTRQDAVNLGIYAGTLINARTKKS